MANSVDTLVGEFEKLVSTLRGMQEKGQEPGQSSLARAVDTQVGILSNALHRSKIDCESLMYAKQYGSLNPEQVAVVLRQIAAAIDNSESPDQNLVIDDIQKIIDSIE